MHKTIFKTIVLLSSLQAVAQENQNDISENYFTENDTVKKLKEVGQFEEIIFINVDNQDEMARKLKIIKKGGK